MRNLLLNNVIVGEEHTTAAVVGNTKMEEKDSSETFATFTLYFL